MKKGEHDPEQNGGPGAEEDPFFRWSRGSDLTAMAIITALSPARIRSIITMLRSPTESSR